VWYLTLIVTSQADLWWLLVIFLGLSLATFWQPLVWLPTKYKILIWNQIVHFSVDPNLQIHKVLKQQRRHWWMLTSWRFRFRLMDTFCPANIIHWDQSTALINFHHCTKSCCYFCFNFLDFGESNRQLNLMTMLSLLTDVIWMLHFIFSSCSSFYSILST